MTTLHGFDYAPRTRVVFGPGTSARVGEFAAEHGARKVLLVTDPGIVKAGHAEKIGGALREAGLQVTLFDQVVENPTTAEVEKCVTVARAADVNAIVGLGGGSSMDTAKGCNFLLTNGGRMQDYWGVGKATQPMLPLICVPTTAGTGSECQSFALIAEAESHQKMACGDPKAAARVSILDPELTLSQPRQVTANTGIDALAHALESAVTLRRNEMSWLFSRDAWVLGNAAFERVLSHGDDLDARGRMQWAAAQAGMAIENSMLGAAHSAANPLTAHFGVIHGPAVGAMLPHVIRFNSLESGAADVYRELAVAAGLCERAHSTADAAEALATRIEQLLDLANIPRSLKHWKVTDESLSTLALEAADQWTATFNPRPVGAEDFIAMYQKALAIEVA